MPPASPVPPTSPAVSAADAVGRTYRRPVPYAVSRAKITEFADALGDDNPAYRDPVAAAAFGHADLVAPPTFTVVVMFGLLEELLADPDLGLALHRVMHADQRFVLHRPVVAGDEIAAELVVERARRMGEADLVFTRTVLTSPVGEPIGEAYATIVHQASPGEGGARATTDPGAGARSESPRTSSAASVVPAHDTVEAGRRVGSLTVPVRRRDLVRYAGASGDFNAIHYSDRVAAQVGLPGVVAHGMLTMAQAARVVTDWVGDPGAVREYAVRFTTPVQVPDDDTGIELAVEGTVGQLLDDARVRVDLRAAVGEDEVLGRARAVVQLA